MCGNRQRVCSIKTCWLTEAFSAPFRKDLLMLEGQVHEQPERSEAVTFEAMSSWCKE